MPLNESRAARQHTRCTYLAYILSTRTLTHTYTYTYTHKHTHTHTHSIHINIHTHTHKHTHTHTHTHTSIYMHIYVCTYVYSYVHAHRHTHMHTHTCECTHRGTFHVRVRGERDGVFMCTGRPQELCRVIFAQEYLYTYLRVCCSCARV